MVKRIILIVSLGLSALAIAAPPIPVAQRKFDHDRHINAARASGKSADCKDCHRMDGNGNTLPGKEHTRCAACHTYPSSCSVLKAPGPKSPARVCETCHVAKRKECLPPDLPPAPTGKSFGAKFTHGKHLTLGSTIERSCVQCHDAQAPATPKVQAHTACSGCHNANGVKPSMTECASCHAAPVGKTQPAADPYRLVGFDHKNHHTISKQSACTGCHDRIVGTGEAALPRPTMLTCQKSCHDGTKAFSATGTKCTQCHKGVTEPAQPTRTDFSFVHASHANRNVKIAECATCHGVEGDGRLSAPLARKDHMPCANAGCHQTEFASRTTKICGVCHDATAPWQKTVSRAQKGGKDEWYESMNHVSHLAKTGTANGACTSCHGEKLTGGPKPGSHDGCIGCHGKGQAPAMTECGACHLKDAPQRPARNQWSVAVQFEKVGGHVKHATDPRSKKGAQCLDCHATVKTAKTLAQIKPSTMTDCDSACHNGKTAFKTTGFECARCHSAPKGAPSAMIEVPAPTRVVSR